MAIEKVTASQIKVGMAARFAPPEWAIMWEVGDATGARHTRFADAVMMSLWPSRGLELHGVEIKVSRSDWKREAADPSKAEAIARYCDRWWVHTAPNVVDDISDMPPAWGLREFDGKRWLTKREAEKTEAQPIKRSFLAALLRRADESMRRHVRESASAALVSERAAMAAEIDRQVTCRTRDQKALSANVAAFEEASGIRIGNYADIEGSRSIGALSKAIIDCGFGHKYHGVVSALDTIKRSTEDLKKAIQQIAPQDLFA